MNRPSCLALFVCLAFASNALAASKQFNTFTKASSQPPLQNAAVETLEACASCRPPTHSKQLMDHGCSSCATKSLPIPLRGDCESCGHDSGMNSTEPFTTDRNGCADCEPFELHPHVGWCIDCDHQGTGVYLDNGDLFHRVTDIDIPGRGFNFRFVRRHVSGVSYDGPLGGKWDYNYNQRLNGTSSTDVTLWDGTGREDVFTYSAGSWSAPAGRFETLTYDTVPTPDQFVLEKPNGTVYQFEEIGSSDNWQLVAISDRFGNTMDFSYDVSDRLETVTDTLGRDIDFTYTGDRITKITDFDSREWTYAYTSGELTSVTTPGVTGFTSGKTTSYGYTSGRLDTITDPKSQLILDVTTWSGTKVDTLRYGDSGDDYDFDYSTPIAGKTTVTDRNGNETVVTLASGRAGEIKEKTNRNVRSGEAADYDTDYSYNGDGLLTQITFPDGNIANYTYASGTNNLTQEELTDSGDTVQVESNWTYAGSYNLVATYKEPRGHDNSNYTTEYFYDFDEATEGDLNGDSVTNGTEGVLVRVERPTVTTQTPNITPADTFRYNTHGQLTRWDKPDGEVTTFEYYTTGAQTGYRKNQVEDDTASGLELTTEWTYSDVGNILTAKDPREYTVTYTVNDLNQVTNQNIPISATIDYDIKYEYDANDNLTKQEVENLDDTGTAYSNGWITTSWTYETLNRVATQVDEVDASTTVTTTYTYDDNRNLTQIQRPEGNKIELEYDERDLLYQRTRGYGSLTDTPAVERRSYTGNRLLKDREFKHGTGGSATWNTYTTTYDDFDRRERLEDPLSHRREWEYDLAGNVTKELGKEEDSGSYTTLTETVFTYAETGWLSERTDKYRKTPTDTATDYDTTYEYRKDGQLSEITDPRSNATTFTYDDAGRRTVTEDEYGNKVTLTLDDNGNITKRETFDKAQAGSGSDVTRTIDYTYDRRNLMLTEVQDPGGSNLALETTWDRDSRGNVVTRTDPRGNEQDYEYDGRNLMTKETVDFVGATEAVTEYTYDDNGNLTDIKDDNLNTTSYTFDDLDRRTKRTNPDSETYTWEYDEEDAVTKTTDENGTVVDNTLDDLGRVTHRDITRATGVLGPIDEDYTYDGVGRMLTAQNDDSKVTFKYDSIGRRYEESTEWRNTPTVTRTVERTFDATGNVTQLTYPDSSDIDYVIDGDLDRIDQVKDGTSVEADYRYVGPFVDRVDYGNDVDRTVTYDAVGRITQIDHFKGATTIAKFDYTYDDNGNVLSEKRTHNSSKYEVFEYDKRNSLARVYYDATTSSSPTTYSQRDTFTLDGAFNIDEVEASVPGFPAVEIDYTVNSRNQYTDIHTDSVSWSDNGELTEDVNGRDFAYDYRGQLVELVDGASTYEFEFDALGRRITTDFGTELRFTWAGDHIVEEITSSGSPTVNATWTWGVEPEPVRMTRSTADHYYHANREGSVERLSDANGNSAESVEYTATGEPNNSSSSTGNPFYWRGEVYDHPADLYAERGYEAGLIARDLAAKFGSRFTSPLADEDGESPSSRNQVPPPGSTPPVDPCKNNPYLPSCDPKGWVNRQTGAPLTGHQRRVQCISECVANYFAKYPGCTSLSCSGHNAGGINAKNSRRYQNAVRLCTERCNGQRGPARAPMRAGGASSPTSP